MKFIALFMCVLCLAMMAIAPSSFAATAKEIDASVDVALERFESEVKGGKEFLKAAKGVLVLPRVIKAGFVVGGEYGEGALKINGKTVAYYSIAAGSFGLQIGVQEKNIILVFMQDEALTKFCNSSGWQIGIDGSVAIINVGVEGSIDSTQFKEPIIGFVFGQRGLMADVSLEGAKITKIKK
jgi:lipid-binding SYLF domain-containing protein